MDLIQSSCGSNDWPSSPRIYVENTRGRELAYQVTEAAVVSSLEAVSQPAELTCRFSDERDLSALGRADILIAGRLDTELIASVPKALRLIQCTSAGVENYAPFDWLSPTTILTNASGVHATKAAEFGLMAALMLHERVPAIVKLQRRHIWDRQLRGLALDRRVLIYGVGALGGAVAQTLSEFGFRVTGIRRSGAPHPAVKRMTTPDRFHDELVQADILILACPLTSETRGLMGTDEFEALPAGAGLLNIARGGLIDHGALTLALETGRLSGAILDVFETEPVPSADPLWDAPNLMVFPHVSADAPDGYVDRCLSVLAENLARAMSGRPLRNVVDPKRGY